MKEYCISKNYFSKLKSFSFGMEADVYLEMNTYDIPVCIKEYNDSFWLSNSNNEVLEKVLLLNEKLKSIGNISPCIVFYDIDEYKKGNKKLIAIGIPFLENYISIDKVENFSDKILCLKNLVILLMKFISLNIYPTDLNSSNIMISSNFDVQLIDLDGYDCKVNPQNPIACYQRIFNAIQYRILTELMLNEEEYNAAYKYSSLKEGLKSSLIQKGFDTNIIAIILDEPKEPKLDLLLEVLDTIEPLFIENKPQK